MILYILVAILLSNSAVFEIASFKSMEDCLLEKEDLALVASIKVFHELGINEEFALYCADANTLEVK